MGNKTTNLVPHSLLLTSQPHPYGKTAFEIIGVRVMSIWWRWGELNPRPKAL